MRCPQINKADVQAAKDQAQWLYYNTYVKAK